MNLRESSDAVNSPAESTTSTTIQDRLDRRVVFTTVPQRIISLSPATTELVFALGVGQRVVGATDYCDFPAEAKQIPRVGSGPMGTISIEAILAKRPDLVLCKFDTHQPLIASLERLDVPVLALGPESIHELCEEAQWLGQVLDCQTSAEEFIQSFQTRSSQLSKRVEALNRPRQKVYYEVWGDPMMSVGQGSFIDELLQVAGLENIVPADIGRYPRINPELIVQQNPQLIFVPSSQSAKVDVEVIYGRPGWQEVAAIRQRRVHLIDSDVASRCGPRMLDALEQMIQAAYPTE